MSSVIYDYLEIIFIGLSPEEKLHGVKYIIESFVGCIKEMVLSAGKAASDLLPIKPLIATKHDNVQEGCIDKCVVIFSLTLYLLLIKLIKYHIIIIFNYFNFNSRCKTEDNICFKGSLCINHYNQLSCDCFGTLYEGEYCDIYGNKIILYSVIYLICLSVNYF